MKTQFLDRKWKQLGMLKLIGFSNGTVLLYPMVVYGGIAYAIDFLFAEETNGEAICQSSWLFLGGVVLCVLLLALLASLGSACNASKISPSTVMRES